MINKKLAGLSCEIVKIALMAFISKSDISKMTLTRIEISIEISNELAKVYFFFVSGVFLYTKSMSF